MTTTADSTSIDEAVIDGLRPQARRYDVAVSDELVLAVLPNGAKTWTWVYDGPGQPHRQTLGVYPEMSLKQARQARHEAAQTRRQSGAPAAYVIRDGRIQPSSTAATAGWKWPLGGALALLAAGLAFGWWLLGDRDPATPVPDARPLAAAPEVPAETMTLETRLDASRQEAPAARRAPADTVAALESPPQPEAQADEVSPTVAPAISGVPEPLPQNDDAPLARVPGGTEPDQTPPAAEPGQPAGAADQTPAPEPRPIADAADQTPAPEPRRLAEAADQTPAPEPRPIADPADQTPAPAADPVVGARLDPQADFEAGVTDARVARAQVTTAVVGREPVDSLGPVLAGNGEDIQTYYFFTELRSLAGQRVRHRWIAGDRIQAEIPFDVGEAWRWRVFSSKRLLASMAGPWRVQVVTEDGAVIHDYAFEFQP